ncbi:MAG: signal peptidase II [Clostridiales bacterium]|nr:signal peptidase II [Clostridiales bacterium]
MLIHLWYHICMKIKEYIRDKKLIIKIVLVFVLTLADLLTKAYFAGYFYAGGEGIDLIGDFVQLTYVENTGAAFGSFGDFTIILTIVSALFLVAFVVLDLMYRKKHGKLYIVAYSFIVAGALGNFIDRLFLHYVRDFIRLSMFNFVCNIADILICVGVVLYAVDMLISMSKDKESDKANE